MRQDGTIAYFGYGSLVNRATLRTQIIAAAPARLSGWRRFWRPRPDRPGFPAALLTVGEQDGASIDGLLIFDRAENLEAVDAREAHYHRRIVSPGRLDLSHPLPKDCPIFLYEAKTDVPITPHSPRILQSYLDAVLQGFLVEHGAASVARFIAETDGFDVPILSDRADPVYPRAVMLTPSERDLFDSLLAAAGAIYVDYWGASV